jgi:hypothetical protein
MTSIIKVDNLQNQCGANIISESANVITIGASGDTVTLAAGASQSGFGRSGSVNWDTTPKTSSPVTAVSGNGYFINTTSGAITINLPSTPAAGDIVAIADYANTSATNNITVGRNGSNIDGEAIDAKIKVNGQVYTLVYVDATEGWKTVGQTFNQINTAEFVAATGGTITTCGNYKIHTFTGPGTFTVTNAGNPVGSTTVDYLVVAGGAGGGGAYAPANQSTGSGGGAGGFRESVPSPAAWTASPLANPGGALPVTATAYPITVGAGGGGGAINSPTCSNSGGAGNPSVFSTITSTGGGGGGRVKAAGNPGGSGGGAGGETAPSPQPGGTGNTPPTSPSQGSNGGSSSSGSPSYGSGGGGGATAAGQTGNPSPPTGAGGAGATTSISGSPTAYAGGGGGGNYTCTGPQPQGGIGGGGKGSQRTVPANANTAGTANSGGGGGGGANCTPGAGAAGGSGIVVIRYKFQ